MKTSSQLRLEACNDLKGQWSSVVVVALIYMAIEFVVTNALSIWYYIEMMNHKGPIYLSKYLMFLVPFITIPLIYGYQVLFLENMRGKEFSFDTLFSGFKKYTPVFKTMILSGSKVFLYGLLLIVPGVIKCLDYAFVVYIMKDKGVYMHEALYLSEQLMKGNRMRLFKLYLSFIGWGLLVLVTLGIAALWVGPYIEATRVRFYNDLLSDSEKCTEPIEC